MLGSAHPATACRTRSLCPSITIARILRVGLSGSAGRAERLRIVMAEDDEQLAALVRAAARRRRPFRDRRPHRRRRRGGTPRRATTFPTSCSWTSGCPGSDGLAATRAIHARDATQPRCDLHRLVRLRRRRPLGRGRRRRLPAQGRARVARPAGRAPRPAHELRQPAARRAVGLHRRSRRCPSRSAIAWTQSGSNCPPLCSCSSASAASTLSRVRYGRPPVIVSNASATARTREASGISSPARPGRIAGPVVPLVVVQHPLGLGVEVGREQDRVADRDVLLELGALVRTRARPASAGSRRAGRSCRRRARARPAAGARGSPPKCRHARRSRRRARRPSRSGSVRRCPSRRSRVRARPRARAGSARSSESVTPSPTPPVRTIDDGEQHVALRLVERDVGLVDEHSRALGVGRFGDADAERAPAVASVAARWTFWAIVKRAPRPPVREQHHELVAAGAIERAHAFDLHPHRARDRLDELVTGEMAALVVDALQAVEVDREQAERRAASSSGA